MAWWVVSLGISAIGALLVAGRSWMTRRIQTKVLSATGPEPTCADVIGFAMRGPYAGETSGSAEPGPGGLITAPLSGTPCVWAYRRTAQRTEISQYLIQDLGDFGEGTTGTFRITDTTGELVVDPAELVPESCVVRAGVGRRFEDHHPELSFEHTLQFVEAPPQPGPNGTVLGTVYEEWALLPFTKVYIPATVTWDGQHATARSPAPAPALNGARFAVSRMSAAQHEAGMRVLTKVMKFSAHLPGASRSGRR